MQENKSMTVDRVLGFVGLGTMGQPLAQHLLKAGHELHVFDRSPAAIAALVEAGAKAATSLTDIGAKADAIFLSLPTPDVVKAVAIGPDGLAGAQRAKTVIDLSTTGPRVAEEVGAGLNSAGIAFVDCPVSGGASGARKGTLALMAAGPADEIKALEAAMQLFGRLFVVGDKAGQGQMLKVINNMISATALVISSEAMVLGAKAGLDPDLMLDVINSGSGRNSATVDKIPNSVLSRTFDFGMTIGLSSKDIRLCLEESDRLGVPMPVGSAVRQMLNITRDQFGADADMTRVIQIVEQWGHAEVRGKAAKS
jgi:3-hydroxyisobutyrate dehydrogenase-like beta-hydroxyacid dehydrogenase